MSARRISHPLTLLGVAVICALLIGLGIWQLQRAEEKQAWFDSYRARINEAPIQITTRLLGPDRSNFAAEVRGRFDGEGQFLWDNRTHQGQPGFHVITPLVIVPGETRILVDRGWIPLSGSRDNLPVPKIPAGSKVISGYLYEPKPGFTLEAHAPEYDSPLRQNLDLSAFASSAPYAVQPYVLRLDVDHPDGFVRVWPVPDQTAVRRHEAYAVQWFGMAVVFIGVVAALWRRELRARRRPVRNETHE